jgi:hypothetical protein
MNPDQKASQFFRMWPRALFHRQDGKAILKINLGNPGVYILYRDDKPYYIGKTKNTLFRRLRSHALKPNSRYYNFWNYFSAFQIEDLSHRDEVEGILISAMPTANSSRPKFNLKKLDRRAAQMLNDVQALMLTGKEDKSGETEPEETDPEETDEDGE